MMIEKWLDKIKVVASSVDELKRYWKVLVGFLSKVSHLEEDREARRIDNMKNYLNVVSELFVILKNNGCSDSEVRKLAKELNIPLIQANLEAMILSRQMNPVTQEPESETET